MNGDPYDEIDALRAKLARYEEAIERIEQWAKAYPLDIFPEPDWKRSNEVLEAAGLSLTAISAYNMRHVITEVAKIARRALEEK